MSRFFEGTPLTPAVWDEVRALLPEDPGLVVGHSLGGQRAMRYALEEGASRLVLLCTRDRPFPGFLAAAERVRQGVAVEETLARWFRPGEAGPVVEYARRCLLEADRERWAQDLESIASFEFDVSLLTMPVLVVAAEFDLVSTPEVMKQMAARMPRGHFEFWEGAGHMSPFLDASRLARLICLSAAC